MQSKFIKCKEFFKKNYIVIILSFLATIFFCYPYLNKLDIQAHDTVFHLTRIQQLSESICNHDFFPMINFGLLGGLGYGNPIFYPQLFLYIPAIINSFGISTVMSYKIFIMIITWATFIIMYYCSNKIFQNKKTAVLSTLLYMFSLYRIVDVYTRGALGEILVFAFLPLIFYGCYEIFYKKSNKWYILPLGIFGIANSHMLSLIFVAGIIVFFMIFNIKSLKHNFKNILVSGIISLLVILSVIIPITEQRFESDYKVFTNGTSMDLSTNSLVLTQIFMNNYNYGEAKTPNSTINGQMTFGIGILLLVCPVLILFCKEKNENKKYIIQCLLLGIITIFMTTKLFPWQLFKPLFVIQIAWRLNVVITAALALVSAYALEKVLKNKIENVCIFAIIIVIVTSGYLNNIQYTDNKSEYKEYDNIGQGEYLPTSGVKFEDAYVYELENKDKIIEYEKNYNEIKFNITEKVKEINVPYTYYKGYKAYIVSDNQKIELKTKMNTENGLTIIENENELIGQVTVTYEKTIIQKISYFISYFTVICIFLYIAIKKIFIKKLT